MSFGVFNFFQKTNENKSTWGIIVVKSNSFVRFLEETSVWKNHFDFVWPLDGAEFVCQWLAFFSDLSCWQLIQDSTPSTMLRWQCDVWILKSKIYLILCRLRNIYPCFAFLSAISCVSRCVLQVLTWLISVYHQHFLISLLLYFSALRVCHNLSSVT